MSWGLNGNGELGDGSSTDQSTPVEVKNLTDVVAVAAGTGSSGHGVSEGNFSLALKKDGTVWGWGSDAFGAIAQTIPDPYPKAPFAVPTQISVTSAKAIAAGADSAFALLGDGTMRAWGDNFEAGLGDGTCHDGPIVTPVTPIGTSGPLDQIKAMSDGHQFGLAVRADGSVWVWGNNGSGQLGDGTKGQSNIYTNNKIGTGGGSYVLSFARVPGL